MVFYPQINDILKIATSTPSSGIAGEYHSHIEKIIQKAQERNWQLAIGPTVFLQDRVRSTDTASRAAEWNQYLCSADFNCLIPPWGGELAIELLDRIDLENISPKWLLGYSDISLLLLATTLKTGMATAHGVNLVELRSANLDPTTAQWETVLRTKKDEKVTQYSSDKFQKNWDFSKDTFSLTEATDWQAVKKDINYPLEGWLLGAV